MLQEQEKEISSIKNYLTLDFFFSSYLRKICLFKKHLTSRLIKTKSINKNYHQKYTKETTDIMTKPNKKSKGQIRTVASESNAKKRKHDFVPPTSPDHSPPPSGPTMDDITEINLQQEKLESMIFDLKEALEQKDNAIDILTNSNTEIWQELQQTNYKNIILSDKVNELEQYSRRNNIRIFGVKDKKEETIQETEYIVRETLRKYLNLNFTSNEFDICHRIGPFNASTNRAIIVRFIYRKSKVITISKRRKLKGSGIIISEDLTPQNVRRLQEIKSLNCVKDSWSKDGRLYAKDNNNLIKEVKSRDVLSEKLFEKPINKDSQNSKEKMQVKTTKDAKVTENEKEKNNNTKENKEKHKNTSKSNDTPKHDNSNDTHKNDNSNDGTPKSSTKSGKSHHKGGKKEQERQSETPKQPPTSPSKASDAPDPDTATATSHNVSDQMEFTCDDPPVASSTPTNTTIISRLQSIAEGKV